MTSDLMPRLGGARTWKDDEPLECVSVVPDGPDVVSFSFRSPSGAWFGVRGADVGRRGHPRRRGAERRGRLRGGRCRQRQVDPCTAVSAPPRPTGGHQRRETMSASGGAVAAAVPA